MKLFRIAIAFLLVIPVVCTGSAAEIPDAIAVKGETVVLQVHAAGAQIYECKADANGRTTWQFREPIASLFLDGKTVGRHYAGPSWEVQGSTIVGRAVGKTPGARAEDIPWLKLEVTDRHGEGPLEGEIPSSASTPRAATSKVRATKLLISAPNPMRPITSF